MKQNVQFLLCIFSISFNLFQLKAAPNKKYSAEEVSKIETSSAFLIEVDSIFNRKYKKVLKDYENGEFIVALEEGLELYDYSKKNFYLNKEFYLTTLLVADIYGKTNNHSRSLRYYRESLDVLKKSISIDMNENIFSNKNFAETYLRIGSVFQKLSRLDSAKFYFKKIENLSNLNKNLLPYKAAAYVNLTGIYELDSLYDQAIIYAKKSIDINKTNNNKIGEAKANINLGNIYLSLDKFELSKKTYLEGIRLIRNDNSQNSVRLKADAYYNLAWAMRNLKEYEAYDYQEKSYDIEDGIRDKELKRVLAEVTAKYDVDAVKKAEENKRLRDRTTFWAYAIGSIIVILSLLYWVNIYKLRQKNLGLELTKTQLIQNQNIEKLKSEIQTRILNATIDGKESERKEIAETLHDSVSALLSSANLHLMATKKQFNGSTPLEIEKTQAILTEASQKIRDLSHTLVSSVLLKFGLNFAVKDIAAKYSNSALNIDTDIDNIRRYEQNFEIKVYNIIQEFVNNILKHSKAENTLIKLYEKDKRLYLKISDDGVGFDKTKIADNEGIGINQIDARIKMMRGKFQIDSKIGEGTVIKVELPLVEKKTSINV